MTDAPQVYRDHLATITGGHDVPLEALWEADAVYEFPYAESLGSAKRLEGIDAIKGYFTNLGLFGPFTFSGVSAWKVEGADEYVLEMHGSSTVLATGAAYEQDYLVRFGISRAGKLAWMREFWDPTRLQGT